jgi:hypothetical protein
MEHRRERGANSGVTQIPWRNNAFFVRSLVLVSLVVGSLVVVSLVVVSLVIRSLVGWRWRNDRQYRAVANTASTDL